MTSLDRRGFLALPAVTAVTAVAGCGGGADAAPPATGTSLAALADLPLDESVVKDKVVLRRTSDTEVTALSAVCTHTGCTVGASGAKLVCPCHGSEYDATTGKVTQGPAQRDLAAVPVAVKDGQVVAG